MDSSPQRLGNCHLPTSDRRSHDTSRWRHLTIICLFSASLLRPCEAQVHVPQICDYCPMVTADVIQGSRYAAKCKGMNPDCPDCCDECEVIFQQSCCECDSVDFSQLARDIAHRAVLLQCPHAAPSTITVLNVRHCREGHMVYAYAEMNWSTKKLRDVRGEIYLAFVDVPCYVRRIADLNYRDDQVCVRRNFQHLPELVSAVNDEFSAQDLLPAITRCTGSEIKSGNVFRPKLPAKSIKREKLIHW